jgi:hypothetical protein
MEMELQQGDMQPAQADEEEDPSFRWPQYIRKHMVRALLAALHEWGSQKHANGQMSGAWAGTELYLESGEDWPRSKHMRPFWKELISDIKKHQGELDLPTDRAIREAAIRWTRAFLLEGTIHDKPAHLPGEQLINNKEHLDKIKDILMAGYTDRQGNVCIYTSLQDANTRSAEFRAAYQATSLTSFQGLWSQLKQLYPRLNTVQIKLKKARDHQLVQVCTLSCAIAAAVLVTAHCNQGA